MPGGDSLGSVLPIWSILPFAGLLLSIALLPLMAPRAWHRHYPKITAGWAMLFALPFLTAYGTVARHEILHILLADYVPFILVLWGLYTVAGGLVVGGTLRGTAGGNTGLLLAGTLLASFTGTTGASMLLVRPLLRANAWRRHRTHIFVFFIVLVANIGGALTPLGDPPLFVGFLHGVPFFWTLHLLPHFLVATGVLLCLFYLLDRRALRREDPSLVAGGPSERLRLEGLVNLPLLAGILAGVLWSGLWKGPVVPIFGIEIGAESLVRTGLILLMGVLSLRMTPQSLRQANGFSWGPIREVAILFAGIFVTIIPALLILKAGDDGPLALLNRSLQSPGQFFWVTGLLSSLLDNAPTYLAFLNTLVGRFHPGLPETEAVLRLSSETRVYLEAVATGAVFMGANTYIGNAPNLMVKAIAEEAGVDMPSFLGYVVRYTLPILLPLFLVIGLIFF